MWASRESESSFSSNKTVSVASLPGRHVTRSSIWPSASAAGGTCFTMCVSQASGTSALGGLQQLHLGRLRIGDLSSRDCRLTSDMIIAQRGLIERGWRHFSSRRRLLSHITWRLRSLQGKVLSVLRLLKAITTFEGGVDYILWKIQRHSGVTVEVEPRLRRRPLLAIWVLSWRLYRRGGFR